MGKWKWQPTKMDNTNVLNYLQTDLSSWPINYTSAKYSLIRSVVDWNHRDKTDFMKTVVLFIKVSLISVIAPSRN